MLVAQLSDTHVVASGETYFGHDSAAYLRDALAALAHLEQRPTCALVTGDLVNRGRADEYARFARIMQSSPIPYFVIPGNHDDRDAMRAALPPATYGGPRDGVVRYTIDDYAVRLIGLDANRPRSPGAVLEESTLTWLASELASTRPTIVAVHQPPFRTGLHYLDAFGFRGARRLRALVAGSPHVGRVVCGHIHCVAQRRIGATLFASAPSTVPTTIPLLFMDGRIVGKRREAPGFALHAWSETDGFRTTVYRRDARGAYLPSVA